MNTLLVQNEADVHTVIETRGGKYVRTISDPGLHLIPPWQKVATRLTKHPVNGIAGLGLRSREQLPVLVSIAFDYTINDPGKYHCAAAQPHDAVISGINAAATDVVSGIGLADLWGQRDFIATRSRHCAAEVLEEKFGITLSEIRVQQISHESGCMSAPGERLKDVMNRTAAAPEKIAAAMGEGLETGISVRKPLTLKR